MRCLEGTEHSFKERVGGKDLREAAYLMGCLHQHELGSANVVSVFRPYISARVNNFLESQ
jgi:hypothetical protein